MVVPSVEPLSIRMSLCVRGLLIPLSTLTLFASVAPVDPPSTLIPAVTFL
jgi:hypothetical protein